LLQAGARASFSFRKEDAGYLVPATGEVEVGTRCPVPRNKDVLKLEESSSYKIDYMRVLECR
jgi:hypothetical protein